MKEIKDITKSYDRCCLSNKRTALATVVHVDGSSYRRPGARMLITEDGLLTGAISGGCLEGDALRKALLVITGNKPMLVTYDTNDEDDATLGMGLGCNGIIQVLIEPINPSDPNNAIELLKKVAATRKPAIIITLFCLDDRRERQDGTCFLFKEGMVINNSPALLNDILLTDAKAALSAQTSLFKKYITSSTSTVAFIEYIKPAVSLVIAGAGNDVMPLVDMANILGWEVAIADGRSNYATEQRFPSCQILVSKPEKVLEHIQIDEQTVFALMTHNYNYDLSLLRELMNRNARYIGLLGPRKKRNRIVAELEESGLILNAQQLASLHGPVGLDIGAETPEEIALSIIAEIQAVLSQANAGQLKKGDDTIHSRPATIIQEVRLDSDK